MSRCHDRSDDGVARWANLSTEERIADLLGDIAVAVAALRDVAVFETPPAALENVDLHAALTVFEIITRELLCGLPRPEKLPPRDPELQDVLTAIENRLLVMQRVNGLDRDALQADAERLAEPYALAFYFEIRRLDSMFGRT